MSESDYQDKNQLKVEQKEVVGQMVEIQGKASP